MSLRIFSPLTLVLLAACGGADSPPPVGETVDCAIGAGSELGSDCTLERVAGTQEIVIHHPDGGFRRFVIDPATGGVAALDGAEPLVPQPGEGDAVQFAIGEDRYSIPADLIAPTAQ